MRRGVFFAFAGGCGLLALAACGRSYLLDGQRAAWRHDAEVACMRTDVVKAGIARIDAIEGPGVCGADFPLKVTLLGDISAMSYREELRPPGSIPNGSSGDMPRWPGEQRYGAPPRIDSVRPVNGQNMRWMTGPQGIDISDRPPAGRPMSITPPDNEPAYGEPSYPPPQRAMPEPPRYPPPQRTMPEPPRHAPPPARTARPMPDDVPEDAVIPRGGSAAVPAQRMRRDNDDDDERVNRQPPPRREPPRLGPRLGPMRGPASMGANTPVEVKPTATLACPMVSALNRWVSQGVQPAAVHWFGSPVVEIKQISAYSCRQMNGAGGHGISEHAFGNALDVAGFTLANGRTVTVKDGWRGSPEEQGFLHDVQLYACQTFNTVLSPGYNAAHYNHFHFDLMRRANGKRPCRPAAIRGEIVAARARARYAAKQRGPAYTGSIAGQASKAGAAVPGADGHVADADDDVTGSIGKKDVLPDREEADDITPPVTPVRPSRTPDRHTLN